MGRPKIPKTRNKGYFLCEEDIPKGFQNSTEIYTRPNKLMEETSYTNLNYMALSKFDIINQYVYALEVIEDFKRQLSEEIIRKNILIEKCIKNDIETNLTLEEIEEFRKSMAISLRQTIDNLMDKDENDLQKEVKKYIEDRALEVLYEVDEATRETIEFQILRQEYQINSLEIDLENLRKNKMIDPDRKYDLIIKLSNAILKLRQELLKWKDRKAEKDSFNSNNENENDGYDEIEDDGDFDFGNFDFSGDDVK
jgi:hypothetical protein